MKPATRPRRYNEKEPEDYNFFFRSGRVTDQQARTLNHIASLHGGSFVNKATGNGQYHSFFSIPNPGTAFDRSLIQNDIMEKLSNLKLMDVHGRIKPERTTDDETFYDSDTMEVAC